MIRDKQGNLKAMMKTSSQVCTSPLGAEAEAVLEGFRLARFLDVHLLTVVSNSLSLIKTIREKVQCESCIATTVWDINSIKNSFFKVSFGHVSRQFNRFARKMVQAGLHSQPHLWLGNYLDWMNSLSLQERHMFFVPVGGSFAV